MASCRLHKNLPYLKLQQAAFSHMVRKSNPGLSVVYTGILAGLICSSTVVTAAIPLTTQDGVPTLAPLLKKTLPTVVHIETQSTAVLSRRILPFPFGDFFSPAPPPQERQHSGAGSGVIIDAEKGHILTNSHVVQKADYIIVTLNDGRRLEAEILGQDQDTDIAVLKISATGLQAIRKGDSEQLRVGDFVLAIGNPFGLEQSVTSGIVSALGRSGLGIESYEDFIQTDASINPGNSGGALINLKGELVGINTAIYAPGGGNIGIGFAIPINMALSITEQLLLYGNVNRGKLGVAVQTLTPDLAKAFGVRQTYGAIITNVEEASAAERAGLRPGDIVLSINGETVSNAANMRNFIGLLRTGTKISLEILRNEKQLHITATISSPEELIARGGRYHPKLNGTVLQDVTKNDPPYKDNGILVNQINPSSAAYRAGLRKDDLIVAANRMRTARIAELGEALQQDSMFVLLNVKRDMRELLIIIK